MPSILTSCLVLLKIAIAVNEGIHTMLSNIYSVLDNTQSDQNRPKNVESIQETDSSPVFKRSVSKSQILEAFNRRRANLPFYEQTNVLVSNMTPFQEITITNKDVEGKRKWTVSPVKKSSHVRTVSPVEKSSRVRTVSPVEKSSRVRTVSCSDWDIESNLETPLLSSSQSRTPSFVSAEIDDETRVQNSFKITDYYTQVKVTNNGSCWEKYEPLNTVGNQNNSPTKKTSSKASRSFEQKSQISETENLEALQEHIRYVCKKLHRISSKAKKISMGNIWGSTNYESATVSLLDVEMSKKSLKEATALCKDFIRNFYTGKDTCTNLIKTPKKSPTVSNSNPSTSKSKENQNLGENANQIGTASANSTRATTPQGPSMDVPSFKQKSNPGPSIEFPGYCSDPTDSDCTGFGYFSDGKPISKTSATKHINIARVPLLKKDSRTNIDDFELRRRLQKLSESSDRNKKFNILAHCKESFDMDSDYKGQPRDEHPVPNSSPNSSIDVLEVSSDRDSSVNLSNRSLPECDSEDSGYLKAIGLERVKNLVEVLHKVAASEDLDEPNMAVEKSSQTINIFEQLHDTWSAGNSDLTGFNLKESISSKKKSALTWNNVLNFENIPFKDLETEEKQLLFLDKVTEIYRKRDNENKPIQEECNFLIDNTITNSKLHIKALEKIYSAFQKGLDSFSFSEDISSDRSTSTDESLETKLDVPLIKMEATINEDWKTLPSPQKTEVGELDAFGLRDCVQPEESKYEDRNASFEGEIICKSEDDYLLDVDENHSKNSFTIDCRRNDTSTPISDEKIEDQNSVSMNLSSKSLNEFKFPSNDAISCVCCKQNRNSTSLNENFGSVSLDCEMKDKLVCSNEKKDGNSLESKDWSDATSEITTNYEKCISILNDIHEYSEDSIMNKESSSEEGNSDIEGVEKVCENKDSVEEKYNGVPFKSNEACLDISKDFTKTYGKCDNMERFEKRESDTKLDNTSTSNNKDNARAEFQCEEQSSCKVQELHASCNLDNATSISQVSAIGNSNLKYEDKVPTSDDKLINICIEKSESRIEDQISIDKFPEAENRSLPQLSLQTSETENSEAIIYSTRSIFKRTSNEPQVKPTLVKEFLNDEYLSKNVTSPSKSCLEGAESKTPNDAPVSSSPISGIEALQRKEELETSDIYDINNDGMVIAADSDCDLHSSDRNLYSGIDSEVNVSTLPSCNVEMNNSHSAENSLECRSE